MQVSSAEPTQGGKFVTSFNPLMSPTASALFQSGAGTSYWPPPVGVTGTVQSQLMNVKPLEVKAGWQVMSAVMPGAITARPHR